MKKLLLALGTVAAVVAPVASVVACGSSKTKAVETKSSVLDQVKATSAYKALSAEEKAKYDSMTLDQLQAALKDLKAKSGDVEGEGAGSTAAKEGEGTPVAPTATTKAVAAAAFAEMQKATPAAVDQAGKLSADDLAALGLDELTLDVNQELIDTYEAYLDTLGKTSSELTEESQEAVASLASTQVGQEAIANLVGQDVFAITDLSLEDAIKEFDTQFSAVSNTDDVYAAPATSSLASSIETVVTQEAVAQAGKLSADDLAALGLDAATLKEVTDAFDAA